VDLGCDIRPLSTTANREHGKTIGAHASPSKSRISVGRFCREQRLTEASFYGWRKRLRKAEPVRPVNTLREY
jgi:hypothetical protein